MTEHQLSSSFSALRNGDREAFHTLYEALSPPVYTVLLRLVGDRQSAEDLLQETFLRLYRQPPGPEVTHPRAWVFQVARNRRWTTSAPAEALFPWRTAVFPSPRQIWT